MNDISDSSIINALGRQMTVTVAKQLTAAGNLANLDTPGYRTKDTSFDDALAKELNGATLDQTAPGHLAGISDGASSTETKEVDGLPSRRDGNNVQLDRELMSMGRAASDFAAAQTALAAKFRLVRYAINEGR